MSSGLDRRDFLKVVGVGTAAGAAACTPRVEEKIIPHVVPPEDQIPGEALWYSSTCTECSIGCGTMVRNREGRAIKIEGNPQHPVSKGGLCARGHSTLQANYHPDRYRFPTLDGKKANWDQAIAAAAGAIGGGGVAVLTDAMPDSTLDRLFDEFSAVVGAERARWSPISHEPLAAAAEIVLGRKVLPAFNFEKAEFILSLGADVYETWLNPVASQKGLSVSRGYRKNTKAKLVHIDARMGLTGANSDEWLAARPGSNVLVAQALLRILIEGGVAKGMSDDEQRRALAWIADTDAASAASASGLSEATLLKLAKELADARRPIVAVGGAADQDVNATALNVAGLLLNKALGAIGGRVSIGAGSSALATGGTQALEKILLAINSGQVKTVVLYGANPVFAAPASWNVADTFKKLDNLIVLDALPNETTNLANVVLPDNGPLESWGDNLATTGAASVQQPTMNPIWDTQGAGDTLIRLAAAAGKPLQHGSFADAMQVSWSDLGSGKGFWADVLKNGGHWVDTAPVDAGSVGDLTPVSVATVDKPAGLTLVAYPHIHRFDGRFSNRAWLQEIPDPLTNAVWSSWVEIHPATARKVGIKQGDKIALKTAAGTFESYAYLTAGVLPEAIAAPLGQGHDNGIGRYGNDIEGNPLVALADQRDGVTGAGVLAGNAVEIRKIADAKLELITDIDHNLVTTDGSKHDLGRGIAQVVALNEISAIDTGEKPVPEKVLHGTVIPNQNAFYPAQVHPEYKWGMVVDTNACTGCGACVASCYSENNIPVVGKYEVAKGREMSWIRIERYYETEEAAPNTRFVPMMCQQCNNAPCEPVCPVIATYHTVEGLNGMVYNRCVGTRYCANNCSYKVRRFNWYGWDDPAREHYAWPEPMQLMLNPDVSVRSDGVMEKCTFCVQRIRDKTESARLDGRMVSDGEIAPACAQSCPTDAIVFGNQKDREARVVKIAKRTNRGYKILDVLNTQPSVTYLKKVQWTGDKA